MANEIYDKSWWGLPEEGGWGGIYYDIASTSDLFPSVEDSLRFAPASSVESGQINANKPLDQNFTFTRASTATFLGSNNLLQTAASGMPRIDYVGNSSGHILLEPSRTNVFQQSNNLSNNTWWSERNGSLNKNITSPTGTSNDAWTVATNSGGLDKRVGMRMRNNGTTNITIPAGTSKTFSIFVKKSSYDFVYLNVTKFQNDMKGDSFFNISNGTLGTVSSNNSNQKIEDYGNGWYRLSVTVTAPASPTDNAGEINWYVANSDNTLFVTADGTSTSFWYGGQIEVGEYGTSYIETTTADVTRVAETATGAGTSAEFNDSEGVLYAEISALADDGTSRRITITDNSGDNFFNIVSLELDEASNNLKAFISSSTSITSFLFTSLNQSQNNKIALKYNSSSADLFVNGSNVQTNQNPNLPTGLVNLNFNNGKVPSGSDFYGKVKEVRVYKTALTDAELVSLTT
jgi:hypothetical protein